MSQDLERVYTINLGKVLLSQSQHRAVRAINMIKEFARHHMKVEDIKIDEELTHQIWAKGVRSPPRKVRVRMSKTDEGYLLVSKYDEDAESKTVLEQEASKVEDKVDAVPTVETGGEDTMEPAPKQEPTKEMEKEEPAPKQEPTKEMEKEEPAPKQEPTKE